MDKSSVWNREPLNHRWIRLCDDYVNLEAQCALLCDLLNTMCLRDTPLDPPSRRGVEIFTGQLKHQAAQIKRQLYQIRLE